MKRSRILNKPLNDALSAMGHGDLIIISDAGFPIPEGKRIDLAIEADTPTITEILELLVSDFIYERVIVAKEQKDYNPNLFARIDSICDRCDIETVDHEHLITSYREQAKFIVRTGAFEPWGNVILCSGVDAPLWFEKPGTIAPDYYQQRVAYTEGSTDD